MHTAPRVGCARRPLASSPVPRRASLIRLLERPIVNTPLRDESVIATAATGTGRRAQAGPRAAISGGACLPPRPHAGLYSVHDVPILLALTFWRVSRARLSRSALQVEARCIADLAPLPGHGSGVGLHVLVRRHSCSPRAATSDDDTITIEDAAAGYTGLLVTERCFRTLKRTHIKMEPTSHWLPRCIGAHVQLCASALLLGRGADLKCKEPWSRIGRTLKTLQMSGFRTSENQSSQRSEAGPELARAFTSSGIPTPQMVLRVSSATAHM